MSKHSFFWKTIAFFLFLAGSILAQIENGSELSLWVTMFGAVLALSVQTFQLLSIPNITQLKIALKKIAWSPLITCDLAIALSGFAFVGRFLGDSITFRVCLSLAQFFWVISYFLIIHKKRTKRRHTW